jgi:hypothetical protein
MQSDFKPIHLKKAKEKLSKQLKVVETDANINEVYKKEIFNKRSLWEKFLALFK